MARNGIARMFLYALQSLSATTERDAQFVINVSSLWMFNMSYEHHEMPVSLLCLAVCQIMNVI